MAVINQGLARRLWPGEQPDRSPHWLPRWPGHRWFRVVGVVPDIHYEEIGEDTEQSRLNVYVPYAMDGSRSMALLVRAQGSPDALVAPTRDGAAAARPDFPDLPVDADAGAAPLHDVGAGVLRQPDGGLRGVRAAAGVPGHLRADLLFGRPSLARDRRPAGAWRAAARTWSACCCAKARRVGGTGTGRGPDAGGDDCARPGRDASTGSSVDAWLFASMAAPLALAILAATWCRRGGPRASSRRSRCGTSRAQRDAEARRAPLDVRAHVAAVDVIVDEAHRLHEGVAWWSGRRTSSRASSGPSTSRSIAACAHLHQLRARHALRPRATAGLPRPEVRRQRAVLVDQLERALRVVDRRFDLAAMADDAVVLQQPLHVARAEARDHGGLELREGAAEVLALAEDRDPAQARLKTFEADLLEQPPVVGDRPAPLVVVVVDVERIGARPRTSAFACRLRRTSPPSPASAFRLRAAASLLPGLRGFFGAALASASSAAFSFSNSARHLRDRLRESVGRATRMASMIAAETTSRVNHLRSAGMTYHGAHVGGGVADGVFVGASCTRRSARARSTSAGENFQCFSGSSSRSRNRLRCSSFDTCRKNLRTTHALARQVALAGVDVFEALTPDVLGHELATAVAGARGCSGARARRASLRSTSD